MKKGICISIGLAVCMSSLSVFASDTLHMVWRKAPINITLPVGAERMISFPGVVKFGYDKGTLGANTLSVVNNNETVYLTAKKAFQSEPVRVLLVQSGKIILMNVAAAKGASDTPVDVVLPQSVPTPATKSSDLNTQTVNYGSLIQFAAHQLYAPARLLTHPGDIFRTPMETKRRMPLLLDGAVLANPLISWRESNAYITAVQVYNNENFSLNLDPTVFCGQWKMAAFYPRKTIAKQSTPNDNTTVFLVSTQPFGQAISECMSTYQGG